MEHYFREINYHNRLERLKLDLRSRYDFTPIQAFSAIDSLREGALNHRNVASFLKMNGYYATESEINAIIRRLDVDADSKITYEEFVETMKSQTFTNDFEESKRFGASPSRFVASPSKFGYSGHIDNSPLRESKRMH